jgi:hypothetical protein
MSNRTKILLRKEQMEVTLPILVEYYVTSRQVKGCSKKTLICLRSNMNMFIRYLAKHGHSLKLSDLGLHDAREYVASLQGTVTKYEGHLLTHPHPNSTFAPETVHTHVRALRGFSTWLQHEAYTKELKRNNFRFSYNPLDSVGHWLDRIVPLWQGSVPGQVEGGHLLVRDLDLRLICRLG